MLRVGRASVFKLCKSNINAKPVINNLSASRERKRRRGAGRHRRKRGASRYEKEEPKRAGRTNCEQQGGTRRRWRLYYTCAFGPSGFAFENEMRKYRLLSPRVPFNRTRGNDPSRRNERYPRKKRAEEFWPFANGTLPRFFLAYNANPSTLGPNNSVRPVRPTWKRDTYATLSTSTLARRTASL